MKMQIHVTVSSDDGAISRSVDGGLQLATGLPEVDSDIAKQDFLTQSENLLRMVGETQMPALYRSVVFAQEEAAKEAEQSNAVAAARVKLSKLRQRKEQEAGQEDARADQGPGVDVVECTDCGAKLESDMAHYVTVVEDGKFKRDAVLCDACYDKVPEARREQSGQPLEADDGGTRPETGGTGDNGEAAE